MQQFEAMRRIAFVLLATVLGLSAVGLAGAQPGRGPKATFDAVAERTAYAPGEVARIAARVEVQESWHLQSTKPALEYLIPTELSVLPASTTPQGEPGSPWPPIQVTFPPDKEYQASFEAEPLLVYEGNFSIVADVPLPRDLPLGPTELVVELSFQAATTGSALRQPASSTC